MNSARSHDPKSCLYPKIIFWNRERNYKKTRCKSIADCENSSVKFLHWKMQGNTTEMFCAHMSASLGTGAQIWEGEGFTAWW